VLLLPRGRLPLHIFEPRYLAMVEDALADTRLIGMIQPDGGTVVFGRVDVPPVYTTGCAGWIADADRTDDGRYYLTLIGTCRFDVASELPMMRGYRKVVPKWDRFRHDLVDTSTEATPPPPINRDRLLATLATYLAVEGITVDWDVLRAAGDEVLVNSLAMICPFETREKQVLLEAATLAERADLLASIMQMAVAGPCSGEFGRAH